MKIQTGPVTPTASNMGLCDPGRAALARGSSADLGGLRRGDGIGTEPSNLSKNSSGRENRDAHFRDKVALLKGREVWKDLIWDDHSLQGYLIPWPVAQVVFPHFLVSFPFCLSPEKKTEDQYLMNTDTKLLKNSQPTRNRRLAWVSKS